MREGGWEGGKETKHGVRADKIDDDSNNDVNIY